MHLQEKKFRTNTKYKKSRRIKPTESVSFLIQNCVLSAVITYTYPYVSHHHKAFSHHLKIAIEYWLLSIIMASRVFNDIDVLIKT